MTNSIEVYEINLEETQEEQEEEEVEEQEEVDKKELEEARRSDVMRQLLCELFAVNTEKEVTKAQAAGNLDVIMEEVTPCSSSTQQLENNLSAIKQNLKARSGGDDETAKETSNRNSGDVVDDVVDDGIENVLNLPSTSPSISPSFDNLLLYRKNIRMLKTPIRRRPGDSLSDTDNSADELSISPNTTKNNSPGLKSLIESKYTENNQDIANIDTNNEIYEKLDTVINDDKQYIQMICPRNNFKNLNRDYEKCKLSRKPPSINIIETHKSVSALSKLKKVLKPTPKQETENKQKRGTYVGDVTFKCHNTYSKKKEDVWSAESLEKTIKHYKKQIEQLEDNIKLYNFKSHLLSRNSSSDMESSECPTTRNEFNETCCNLDRGDFNIIDNQTNLLNKLSTNIGHNNSTNVVSNRSSTTSVDASKDVVKKQKQYCSNRNVFVNSSKETYDSGLRIAKTLKTDNEVLFDEETDPVELFPKIMYPSSYRNISTQITDSDWLKICASKKEMSKLGTLKLSLPNSSDEEVIECSAAENNKKTVNFIPTTTIITNNSSECNSLSEEQKLTNINRNKIEQFCFPCLKIYHFFTKR